MALLREQLLELHDFWFPCRDRWATEDEARRWYSADDDFDRQLRAKFGGLVAEALAGKGRELAAEDRPAVALIVALDQLPRNIYRGSAQAFAGDAAAQQLTLGLLEDEARFAQLWPAERQFVLMPLMHAENLQLQEESLRRFKQFAKQYPPELAEFAAGQIKYAQEHRDIVARFGKFPYRDQALGRATSADEQHWIDASGISYGQG